MVFEEKTIPFRGTWLFKQISKVQFINLKPNSNNTYGYWNTFAKHFNRLLAFFGLLMRRSVHSANPRVVFLRCPTLTAPTHTIVHPRTTSITASALLYSQLFFLVCATTRMAFKLKFNFHRQFRLDGFLLRARVSAFYEGGQGDHVIRIYPGLGNRSIFYLLHNSV